MCPIETQDEPCHHTPKQTMSLKTNVSEKLSHGPLGDGQHASCYTGVCKTLQPMALREQAGIRIKCCPAKVGEIVSQMKEKLQTAGTPWP